MFPAKIIPCRLLQCGVHDVCVRVGRCRRQLGRFILFRAGELVLGWRYNDRHSDLRHIRLAQRRSHHLDTPDRDYMHLLQITQQPLLGPLVWVDWRLLGRWRGGGCVLRVARVACPVRVIEQLERGGRVRVERQDRSRLLGFVHNRCRRRSDRTGADGRRKNLRTRSDGESATRAIARHGGLADLLDRLQYRRGTVFLLRPVIRRSKDTPRCAILWGDGKFAGGKW